MSSRFDVMTTRAPEAGPPETVTLPAEESRMKRPPGSSLRLFSIRVPARAGRTTARRRAGSRRRHDKVIILFSPALPLDTHQPPLRFRGVPQSLSQPFV